jgi:hypothetical protein
LDINDFFVFWSETGKRFFPNSGWSLKIFTPKILSKLLAIGSLYKELSACIASHKPIRPVSFGIVIDDFNSFSLDHRKFFTGATLSGGGSLVLEALVSLILCLSSYA